MTGPGSQLRQLANRFIPSKRARSFALLRALGPAVCELGYRTVEARIGRAVIVVQLFEIVCSRIPLGVIVAFPIAGFFDAPFAHTLGNLWLPALLFYFFAQQFRVFLAEQELLFNLLRAISKLEAGQGGAKIDKPVGELREAAQSATRLGQAQVDRDRVFQGMVSDWASRVAQHYRDQALSVYLSDPRKSHALSERLGQDSSALLRGDLVSLGTSPILATSNGSRFGRRVAAVALAGIALASLYIIVDEREQLDLAPILVVIVSGITVYLTNVLSSKAQTSREQR